MIAGIPHEARMLSLTIAAAVFLLQIPRAARSERQRLPIVIDGQAAATIITAERPCRSAAFGAWELNHHVRRITGAELPILSPGAKASGTRILVGDSAATRELGLDGADFGDQEYLIKFLPDTLVLLGKDDNATSGSNISLRGNTDWVEGKFGKALQFDGTDSGLSVENPGFSDDAGTLEGWVRLSEETQDGEATVFRLDGNNPWTYHIVRRVMNTNCIAYVVYDGEKGRSVTSGELTPGWHHIAATHDIEGGIIELFIDGESAGTAPYAKTTCKGATLGIGAMVRGNREPGNVLDGRIDEVRVSNCVREYSAEGYGGPYETDPDTIVLLHLDEGTGTPIDRSGVAHPVAPPGQFEAQGTSYAVHDFLERFCDVRWYGPTELGLVYPQTRTLTVEGDEIRREPAIAYRQLYPPTPSGMAKVLWDEPTRRQMNLFWARHRAGGQKYAANHSFYGYYDRFWEKNPDRPDVFEQRHEDWFAKGYGGRPPQMCYTNEGFIGQVVADARNYFDGKGLAPGARAAGDYFALVPMDNGSYCKCADCQARMNADEADNPQFSNGYASDYIFGFVNRVARQLRETHPDKYLSSLAYADYAYYPRDVDLEPNISVQMCLHVRNWWAPSMEENDMSFYRDWVENEGERRPLYLWLYYCFPEEIGNGRGFNCFPGFFAHTAARQIKMFARDGIRGAFLNGLGEQVDTYVTLKLFDDPERDVDEMLDEFFSRYYGAAAEPMKKLYLRIEQIYSDPANYPEAIQSGDRHSHQTEEMAWGYLGTAERMAELGGLMEKAIEAAETETEQQRVALFKRGVWDYMVEGREQYARRQAMAPERERLKKQPPRAITVGRVPAAGGDLDNVPWDNATPLGEWYTLDGYPTDREVSGRVAHDGEYLYVELSEKMDTGGLQSAGDIWRGDDWEVFFARQRAEPYRQFGVAPNGEHRTLVHGADAVPWEGGIRVQSDTSAGDTWTVRMAFELEHLLAGGVDAGDTLYAGFYRASPGASHLLAWSPNFSGSFHNVSRLGELTLQK